VIFFSLIGGLYKRYIQQILGSNFFLKFIQPLHLLYLFTQNFIAINVNARIYILKIKNKKYLMTLSFESLRFILLVDIYK